MVDRFLSANDRPDPYFSVPIRELVTNISTNNINYRRRATTNSRSVGRQDIGTCGEDRGRKR